MDWRDGTLWTRIGYALTVAWIVAIVAISGGDVRHPLFDLIFLVPLGTWIVALTAINVVKRLRNR